MKLRIYPYPYINMTFNEVHLNEIVSFGEKFSREFPTAKYFHRISATNTYLTNLAFAYVYGKEQQFIKKTVSSYRYESSYDFTHGSKKIKLVYASVRPKDKNTGSRMVFKTSVRTLGKGKNVKDKGADIFILAAYNIPNISFVGYTTREELVSGIRGYYASIPLMSPSVKPIQRLSLEKYRVRGYYV